MRPANRLLGRQREAEALREALGQHRIVTVVGPAGVGKSRLVRELLGEQAVWCSLGAAREPTEVLRALAAALGMTPPRAAMRAAVSRVLATKRSERPVVLDGADQAAGVLREWLPVWLAPSPVLRFVASARARLGIEGEHVLALGPPSAEEALAIWLDATERLGHRSEPALGREIVERLDRLPLALEWWASRAALLGDAACLERLRRHAEGNDPLGIALEESLATLGEDEREALGRIAMFERGVPATALAELGVALEQLDRLGDRALVRIERAPGVAPRVVAYWPVVGRMRALARQSGRWDAHARAHAAVAVGLSESAAASIVETQQARPSLREELEAVAERFEDADPALALRACLGWCPLAHDDGTAEATVERLARLMARVPSVPGSALLALGALERKLGRVDAAREHLEAARAAGEPFEASIEVAHLDRMQSRLGPALHGYQAALELARSRGDAEQQSVGLGELGRMLQSLGRYREAQQHHQDAIALQRSLGLQRRVALERSLHARATHRAGDVREAIPLHEQALALHEQLGERRLAAAERGHLGFCQHELGALGEAEALFRQSVDGLAAVGDVALECIERTLLARLLCDQGRYAEAKLELAIVEPMARELDMPRVELTRRFVAGLVAIAEGDLGEAERLWQAALELELHREVGFETLLPAHLALCQTLRGRRSAATRLLRRSTELVGEHHAPGVRAAFHILAAAVRGEPAPEVPTSLVSSSSDVRRALRLGELAGVAPALRVTEDGRRVELPDGTAFELGRRAAPRRLLLALARTRHEHAGQVLAPDELIAAGWPDERMRPDAARQRLRTAIWTLRKLGLEAVLLTRDEGYLLDPQVPLVWMS